MGGGSWMIKEERSLPSYDIRCFPSGELVPRLLVSKLIGSRWVVFICDMEWVFYRSASAQHCYLEFALIENAFYLTLYRSSRPRLFMPGACIYSSTLLVRNASHWLRTFKLRSMLGNSSIKEVKWCAYCVALRQTCVDIILRYPCNVFVCEMW
jgi:hypothetical protein